MLFVGKCDSCYFSEVDINSFNDHLDFLGKDNKEVGKLEKERKYFLYWYDTVSVQMASSAYRLSSYYNDKIKVN